MKKGILVGALAMLSIGAMSRIEPPPATGYGATLAPMTADVTYYADPVNGSDSNPCTSGLPCRTIAHVQTLIPLVMDFNATIYLAAGVYNEVLTFANMDRGLGASKSITLQGQTWAAFTPATGPQTGQFTSGSGRVATMTGAGWTVNDLRSSHVKITSGTKSGNYYPIASNTADGISLPISAAYMAAIATATFEIVRPGAVISHASIGTAASLVSIVGTAVVDISTVDVIGSNFYYGVSFGLLTSGTLSSVRMSGAPTLAQIYSLNPVVNVTLNDSSVTPSATWGVIGYRISLNRTTIAGTSSVGVNCYLRLTTNQAIIDGPGYGVIFTGAALSAFSAATNGMDIRTAANSAIRVQLGYLNLLLQGSTIDVAGTGILIEQLGRADIQIISGSSGVPNTITTAADGIRVATAHNSIVIGQGSSVSSSAGYGVNMAYTYASGNSYDSGAVNSLRVGSSDGVSGFTADINLGDSTTSLTALRALPGKVLVGATTLNRAVSF